MTMPKVVIEIHRPDDEPYAIIEWDNGDIHLENTLGHAPTILTDELPRVIAALQEIQAGRDLARESLLVNAEQLTLFDDDSPTIEVGHARGD